jgi:hypothetical protein
MLTLEISLLLEVYTFLKNFIIIFKSCLFLLLLDIRTKVYTNFKPYGDRDVVHKI